MRNTRLVAPDACAWPVLLRLADGRLGLVHHNRPSHGFEEGDLVGLVSADEGETWTNAGTPAPHHAGGNRTHVATGLTHTGDWIVLSTGHLLRDSAMVGLGPLWCSTLTEGATQWRINEAPTVSLSAAEGFCIPHGRILALADGRLAATVYRSWGKGQPSKSWVLFSTDNGATWGDAAQIGDGDTNEVVLLDRGADGLLAAVRTHRDHHLELFGSSDTGNTWTSRGPLTLPMQHPGDLTDLGENRLLLTYGIRNRGLMGLGARLSKDGGSAWGAPAVFYQFGDAKDCGYPSTVACNDGSLLTACYSDLSPLHTGYHLLTVRWQLEDFFNPTPLGAISDGKPMTA